MTMTNVVNSIAMPVYTARVMLQGKTRRRYRTESCRVLVYVHGNCQARAIAQMLAPAFPEWDITYYEVFK